MFIEGKVLERKMFGDVGVIFRFPKKDDTTQLMNYINSLVKEGARIGICSKVSFREEKAWLSRMLEKCKRENTIFICIEVSGSVVGVGSISKTTDYPSVFSHVGELGFGILKPYRKKGIVSYIVQMFFRMVKKQWELELVKSSYASDNLASATLHKKLGFEIAGRIPDGAKYGDTYLDEIIAVKKL